MDKKGETLSSDEKLDKICYSENFTYILCIWGSQLSIKLELNALFQQSAMSPYHEHVSFSMNGNLSFSEAPGRSAVLRKNAV